ncbi:MAG: sialidase family protein [Bacteroidia bacterium]
MRLKILFFSLLAGSCLPSVAHAQASIKNILLDNDLSGYPPCEPSVAISFSNNDEIVAGAVLDKVYHSHDGGQTWEKQRLTSNYGVFGDPVVIADYRSNFYYFHLSDPSGKRWVDERILDRIVCQKSSDGGRTWDGGSFMGMNHPKDQDKEWAVASPYKNHIAAAWTQFDKYESREPGDSSNILFSLSPNGGKSWKDAVRINEIAGNCLDDSQTAEGAIPAFGPGGEIYVAWSLNEKIYFDRSLNRGKTWLDKDIVAATQPGGWSFDIPGVNRCNGMPVLVCDNSDGDRRGTLYLNWSDQRSGTDDTDIWFASSSDQGNTWTSPVRVNNDGPGKQQFFTWMAVDQTSGNIYIVFYDRRNYNDLRTDVYLAWSTDGGKTFANRNISETPFVPDKNLFLGDYNNIAAHDGRICPVWTRMDEGRNSVWTAVISETELTRP